MDKYRIYHLFLCCFCFNTNELWHKYTRKYWFSRSYSPRHKFISRKKKKRDNIHHTHKYTESTLNRCASSNYLQACDIHSLWIIFVQGKNTRSGEKKHSRYIRRYTTHEYHNNNNGNSVFKRNAHITYNNHSCLAQCGLFGWFGFCFRYELYIRGKNERKKYLHHQTRVYKNIFSMHPHKRKTNQR